MNSESRAFSKTKQTKQPVCLGTGLITLDVLINGEEKIQRRLMTGGSCGNVLIILSYLGWKTYPIICLGKDSTSRIILKDMKKWGVQTELIFQSGKVSSPIIVEKLYNNGNFAVHQFKFCCPFCGATLPRNRPLPKEFLEEAERKLPYGNAFYFDRASTAAMNLATKAKKQGAVVFFEPHRVGSRRIFKKCLELADIVKYSWDQIEADTLSRNACLEIQTMGAKGLRYRFNGDNENSGGWKERKAFPLKRIVDSAGAGDWCSAGLIYSLGKSALKGLRESTLAEVEMALNFCQGLSALKCNYEGPRGLMYNLKTTEVMHTLQNIMSNQSRLSLPLAEHSLYPKKQTPFSCPSCLSKNLEK